MPAPVMLCLDVGIQATGIAVWGSVAQEFLYTECFRTKCVPKKVRTTYLCEDNARRQRNLLHCLCRIRDRFNVLQIVAEMPSGGAQNQKAATGMASASALVVSFAYLSEIPLEIIIPSEIKRIVSSGRSVSKEQVIAHVVEKYGRTFWKKKDDAEHIADAIMCRSVIQRRLLKRKI